MKKNHYGERNPFYGKHHTNKTKKKLSDINKGENHPNYGKHLSDETKKKISEANKGKRHSCSEETKKKLSEANKGEKSYLWKGGVKKRNIPLYDTYAHQISYAEKVRRNENDQNILEVKCSYCGKWYIPKLNLLCNRIRGLEGAHSEYRLYCSTQCKQECPIFNQHKWPKGFKPSTSREVQPELRQMCFDRDKFTCQKCGLTQDELETGLHCHHIEGIKWEPLESADLDKVITLCKNCHKKVHKQLDCGYHDMRCK